MPLSDLSEHFARVDKLADEINRFVPTGARGVTEFRADLAGLFVVAVAASYEACVKEILVGYALRHHEAFGHYTAKQYEKLNIRIGMSDLHSYTKLFGPEISPKFKNHLKSRKGNLIQRIGLDIESSYSQILSWRHDFAHAGRRNTTIEEAVRTHRLAKRVIYAFDAAFLP